MAYLLGTRDGAKVSRYELTSREPSLETILAYETIFGVTSKELFAGRSIKVDRAVTRLLFAGTVQETSSPENAVREDREKAENE